MCWVFANCLLVGVFGAGSAAFALTFDGIAAGDATASEVILWTRADSGGQPVALTAQVSPDAAFSGSVRTYTGTTDPAADDTLKLAAGGLLPNTAYFYRFTDGTVTSPAGRFTTPPAADAAVPVRFGFSGDSDARFRPFPAVAGFGTTAGGSQALNYFIFLGDTMYETGATGSPPTVTAATDGSNAQQVLIDYHRKYLEVLRGVSFATGVMSTEGQQGIQEMLAATGGYTLLDNHELGNRQLQSGGGPQVSQAASSPASSGMSSDDVNTTGFYNNKSPGFKALVRAYLDYHPVREVPLSAPDDPRSDGTHRLYFAQTWGRNSLFVNIDDRSYRDSRLEDTHGKDDIGIAANGDLLPNAGADNPNRTMLGATQFAWLKQVLLDAQASGTIWKILTISTPIDTMGGRQDGKSWYGGYRAERNALLKFIADHAIDHVLFLTTDDHEMRATRLLYVPDPVNHPNDKALLPNAFQVLTGPIGAGGPHLITDHSFANIQALLNNPASSFPNDPDLIAHGDPPIGLMGFPGLMNVWRMDDPEAASNPRSIDFFAPDQNGYTIVRIDAAANLTVETYGIPSYKPNSFPQPKEPARLIMRFQINPR